MHTPAYFGSIGLLNAPHLERARRRSRVLGYAGASLKAVLRRLMSGGRRPGDRLRP